MVPPDEVKPGVRGTRHRLRGDTVLKPRPPAAGAPPVLRTPPTNEKPASTVLPTSQPHSTTQRPHSTPQKKRVLFVCIGNSCRSQMAEAFARAYGADILVAQSAGLSPAMIIAPLTKQVLAERNLNIDDHFPKGLEMLAREPFDVAVNMSGHPAKLPAAQVITWNVRDPIGEPEAIYRTVVQQIEGLVMGLILALRAGRNP